MKIRHGQKNQDEKTTKRRLGAFSSQNKETQIMVNVFVDLFEENRGQAIRSFKFGGDRHLLAEEFIYRLTNLLRNENAVDRILATREIIDLFSTLENTKVSMVFVAITKIDADNFTLTRVQGVHHHALLNCAIVFHEEEFKLMRHVQAAVFDVSDTFLNNFVTELNFNLAGDLQGVAGFLRFLVKTNRVAVLRMLLDNVEDMEVKMERINEPTPFQLACLNGNEEIVTMFVYYNVVPSLPSIQMNGNTYHRHPPIFYATNNDHETIIETLIDYTFDKWSDFDVDFLLQLMFTGSPNLERVTQMLHQSAYTMPSFCASLSSFSRIWSRLFTVGKHHLKRALTFFRTYQTCCDVLMESFGREYWDWYWSSDHIRNQVDRKVFFENLYVLGSTLCEESDDEPKPTFLRMMMDKLHDKWPLRSVLKPCTLLWIPFAEIEPIVLLLLANNAPLDSFTFDFILRFTLISDNVDSRLFDICRFLDVNSTLDSSHCLYGNYAGPVASSYYHRFPLVQTMMDVLRDPVNIHDIDIAYYIRMSSHPTVKNKVLELADSRNEPEMRTTVDNMPEFPPLLEFARDAARKYVVERYDVKTSWQFYAALDKVEVSEYLRKIIAYDLNTPLYNMNVAVDYP